VLGVFAREPHSECVMDQMTPTHAIAGQCFTPLQIAERVESVSAEPVLTERIFYVTSVGFMACLPTAGKIYAPLCEKNRTSAVFAREG
jgi:hypothetical protein